MFTKKRVLTICFLFLAVPLIALAAAPDSLSVLIGGKALNGKALWYEGKIYVPLESVSEALNADYRYDSQSGVASVDLYGHGVKVSKADRPRLKITRERVFSTGDNLKVLATVTNKGLVPARELEIICTFHGTSRNELTASVAQLPELKPGERKTVEFWLYEQRIPDASGGRPYAQPISVPGAYVGRGDQYVYVGTDWQRVTYNLEFDYLNPDNTYSTKDG
jgi:hypothetical protein